MYPALLLSNWLQNIDCIIVMIILVKAEPAPHKNASGFRWLGFLVLRYMSILPITFRITSPALEKPYNYPDVGEVILTFMGK